MTSLVRELKITIRLLWRSPGFTATAVLMLTLGIGATTAIFSVVEAVLLRPLPFPDSKQLMVLSDVLQGTEISESGEAGVTVPDIKNYTRDTHSFSSLGAYTGTPYELSGAGEPATINGTRMTGGVFPALEVSPLLGRVFTQQEDDQRQQVVVLSYATWQSRFQRDPSILGKKILLDRNPYLVIGVMPNGFEFPLNPGQLNRSELWVPMSFHRSELSANASASWNYSMVGRLAPGVNAQQAVSDADRVAKATMRGYPAFMAGFSIHAVVRPLQEETVEDARPLVRTLFLAVAVVLLIACANLAGLLLVRAIRRRREVAVRLALGASAFNLMRQAVLESMVLSVTGGLLGLGAAYGLLHASLQLLPETLPRVSEITLDWPVALFALGVSLVTGLVCGLAPAFAAIRTGVNDTLKEGGRTGSGGGHARLRSGLVVAEIAVALVLLTASGLLLRSFEKMRQVELGYHADHALVTAYSLPRQQYPNQAAVDRFNHELLLRLGYLPGIKSVGITSFLPAIGSSINGAFVAEGYVAPKGESLDIAAMTSVGGNYFEAMGIPLLHGRFLGTDDRANAPLAIVVNHKLATQSWPGQNPIGKRLRLGSQAMATPWATVVGEVADVKENSPDQPSKQQFYMAIEQVSPLAGSLAAPTDLNGNGGYIAMRTAMDPKQMENSLRATVRAIDAQLPLTQMQTMEEAISGSEAPRKFNTALISSFAAAALLLAVLGIYSVIAFSVALRVQEMAIRMALGSPRSQIIRMVLLSGVKLAAIGCILGLLGALAASRLIGALLFGVSAFDPTVLILASVCVFLLTVAATLLPARRAASVDPMLALRSE